MAETVFVNPMPQLGVCYSKVQHKTTTVEIQWLEHFATMNFVRDMGSSNH